MEDIYILEDIYFESVRRGHPDKMCDYIADSILDAYRNEDKGARVACECFFAGKNLIIGGEISSTAEVDVIKVAKDCIANIGYNPKMFEITSHISKQSPEIDNLVSGDDIGAGDQGIVIGYACKEEGYLPREFQFIQNLMARIDIEMVENVLLTGLMPDGKGYIARVDEKTRIHVSYESKDDGLTETRQEELRSIIKNEYYSWGFEDNPEITFIEYHFGGPLADTGLTGRKIVVDTYGGAGGTGGGALCGKDPSKVDRTGAYLARQLAISIIDYLECDEVEVKLGYSIGESKPVSIQYIVSGLEADSNYEIMQFKSLDKILELYQNTEDIKVGNLIKKYFGDEFRGFNRLSAYGHFGRLNEEWEKPLF